MAEELPAKMKGKFYSVVSYFFQHLPYFLPFTTVRGEVLDVCNLTMLQLTYIVFPLVCVARPMYPVRSPAMIGLNSRSVQFDRGLPSVDPLATY